LALNAALDGNRDALQKICCVGQLIVRPSEVKPLLLVLGLLCPKVHFIGLLMVERSEFLPILGCHFAPMPRNSLKTRVAMEERAINSAGSADNLMGS
jgi:hypothetical protein